MKPDENFPYRVRLDEGDPQHILRYLKRHPRCPFVLVEEEDGLYADFALEGDANLVAQTFPECRRVEKP